MEDKRINEESKIDIKKGKKTVKKLKLKKIRINGKTTKEKKVKGTKQKKSGNKMFLSILIIIISFLFIVGGIVIGLIGTGVIKLDKDNSPVYYSLAEKVKVGHYVVYDAGTWEEDKNIPNRGSAFTFGGYASGASRNDGITCNYISDEEYSKQMRSGWRVFSVEDDIVTLIHDGISMCYYHGYGNNTNDKSVEILSGNNESINFDYYLDNKYVSSVRILSKEDIDKFNHEDSSYKKIENSLISVGIPYWLASKGGTNFMWYVTEGGMVATDQVGMYGVRVLVTLAKDVKTTGLTDDNKWILAMEDKDIISEE